MIELDFTKCKLPPYKHQVRGTKRLITHPRYGLFWEMRVGKTKCIIDTASFLHQAGELDAVIIACPAQVVDVWAKKDIGEIVKHSFVESKTIEFDSANADFADILMDAPGLKYVIISHELLRQEDRSSDFPRAHQIRNIVAGLKTWVVFDEASAFGSWKSLQTKSALRLRELVGPTRLTTMDGTPIGNSPIEQYSKFKVLGEDILGYRGFHHFRAVHQVAELNRYARRGKAYVGFQKQFIIDAKVKDFCEYLEQKDCLDMPSKVSSFITVRLSPKTWRVYSDMRDELCAEIDSGTVSAQHASVKVLRLAQICTGFVGGVENEITGEQEVAELSDESCVAIIDWLKRRFNENPNFKCVLWCRWRPEIELLARRAAAAVDAPVRIVYGQTKTYKDELHPDNQYEGGLVLVAQPQALRYGVNLSKATVEVFCSQDYNRITRSQAEERLQAPVSSCGRSTTLVIECLIEGPKGERTIVHDISNNLKNKHEVAHRTAKEWKRILEEK